VHKDDPAVPTSPYGSSKLMTEIMLRDAGAAHGLRYMMLRYFNVAGADPLGRTGPSTKGATHLIKVSVETALGLRPKVDVFVTDYPTPDGTCIPRLHSRVRSRARARGGESVTLNCGYGRGFSVLEVIETVKGSSASTSRSRSSGGGPVTPHRSWRPSTVPVVCSSERPDFDNLQTIMCHALAWEQAFDARRLTASTASMAITDRQRVDFTDVWPG
jgi:UDP-glucose 4-epimerase